MLTNYGMTLLFLTKTINTGVSMDNYCTPRHNWDLEEVLALFEKPLMDLLYLAHSTHRQCFDPNAIQHSTLLSIKTGACPEDCGYCSQSGHFNTDLKKEKLIPVEEVIAAAKNAKQKGASRFCMGAAWRSPSAKDMPKVIAMIKEVRELGLETCMTLGMLSDEQAKQLADAGLDYYNHNLDTSRKHYPNIVSTRNYQDRLDTLEKVRQSGMKVCCGGILGMGETREDRASLLIQLANLSEHPESVPVNMLAAIPGTPMANAKPIDKFEFVRTIALARIMMPKSFVRLSAGRASMSEELQALCFFAGANSIHFGEKLLTTSNPEVSEDMQLLKRLGLKALELDTSSEIVER